MRPQLRFEHLPLNRPVSLENELVTEKSDQISGLIQNKISDRALHKGTSDGLIIESPISNQPPTNITRKSTHPVKHEDLRPSSSSAHAENRASKADGHAEVLREKIKTQTDSTEQTPSWGSKSHYVSPKSIKKNTDIEQPTFAPLKPAKTEVTIGNKPSKTPSSPDSTLSEGDKTQIFPITRDFSEPPSFSYSDIPGANDRLSNIQHPPKPAPSASISRDEQRSEPTVNITIGCIEVRAVTSPSLKPSFRKAQKYSPSLSLNAYLKERNNSNG